MATKTARIADDGRGLIKRWLEQLAEKRERSRRAIEEARAASHQVIELLQRV